MIIMPLYRGMRCGNFQDWVFDHGLMDLGYIGSDYTWLGG